MYPSAQIGQCHVSRWERSRCEASRALSYFRFRGIADMAALAAGSTRVAIDVVDDARSRHRMCQRGDR